MQILYIMTQKRKSREKKGEGVTVRSERIIELRKERAPEIEEVAVVIAEIEEAEAKIEGVEVEKEEVEVTERENVQEVDTGTDLGLKKDDPDPGIVNRGQDHEVEGQGHEGEDQDHGGGDHPQRKGIQAEIGVIITTKRQEDEVLRWILVMIQNLER